MASLAARKSDWKASFRSSPSSPLSRTCCFSALACACNSPLALEAVDIQHGTSCSGPAAPPMAMAVGSWRRRRSLRGRSWRNISSNCVSLAWISDRGRTKHARRCLPRCAAAAPLRLGSEGTGRPAASRAVLRMPFEFATLLRVQGRSERDAAANSEGPSDCPPNKLPCVMAENIDVDCWSDPMDCSNLKEESWRLSNCELPSPCRTFDCRGVGQ
mmetsp:Transcript_12767/g.45211  ORF Transcript_12767/g.45211 Transcript_12767/m.45211 type:complete len:215 (+) Transcript_12767:3005-3649(+)